MPQPTTIALGPFDRGLNLAKAPHLLESGEAVEATAVDIEDGTLKGMYGPGSVVASVSSYSLFMHYEKDQYWITRLDKNWGANDAGDSTGSSVVYRTDSSLVAKMNRNGVPYDLGIDAPANQPTVASGATGGARAYSMTFVNSATGWESNPLDVTATVAECNGAVLSNLASVASTADSGVDAFRIYGTQAGTTAGTRYRLTELSISTTNWTDTGVVGTTSLPLNWGIGGWPDNVDMEEDHAPAPILTCLADSLHSFAEGTGTQGSGILFGATNNWLRWSMLGFPAYWPFKAIQKFDDEIEAIVSEMAVTYIFTSNAIYAVSGSSHEALTFRKTRAPFGVKKGCGKTVQKTPKGIMFLAQAGIAVFDGIDAQVVTEGVLRPSDIYNGTHWTAAYFDDYYFLAYLDISGFILDMSDPGSFKLTSMGSATYPAAFHVTPYEVPPANRPGLYLLDVSGEIKEWGPRRGIRIDGAARQSWVWRTGKLTAGFPTREKEFTRFWIRKTGTVTIKFYIDDVLVHTGTDSSWLPATAFGRALQVEFSSSDPTAIVYDMTIECEVQDGA